MRRTAVLLLTLLAASLAVVPAAHTAQAAQAAQHQRVRGTITFVKNRARPDDSLLTWTLQQRRGGAWVTTDRASWRAGSGMLGKRG
ncbi:MAG TPA: hypothetical protein VF416_04785, partial [Marmoricola sp.]